MRHSFVLGPSMFDPSTVSPSPTDLYSIFPQAHCHDSDSHHFLKLSAASGFLYPRCKVSFQMQRVAEAHLVSTSLIITSLSMSQRGKWSFQSVILIPDFPASLITLFCLPCPRFGSSPPVFKVSLTIFHSALKQPAASSRKKEHTDVRRADRILNTQLPKKLLRFVLSFQ